jgi:pyruvate kinase
MPGRTKIVATLGPASDAPEVIEAMILAGLDVVRLNLSHGTVPEHLDRLARVRAAAEKCGRHVAVLADLPGPKVRSGIFPEGGAFLMVGSRIRLSAGEGPCSAYEITVDYPSLLEDVRVGDAVILGDGAITLRVCEMHDDHAVVVVETGGRAQGRPGVHIPAERLRLTAPTEQDLELIEQIVPAGVDFLAVSFVRGPDDLHTVRAACGPNGPMLVAKIETAPAVANLDEILAATDVVMVARGDLGIECPLEDVPHVQKQVIRACVTAGVPVITATQMLESMIHSPAPTRAEVSDVANAVFDGTDAVMLSAETAIGHDPVLVVKTMARIAEKAEAEADYKQWAGRLGRVQRLMALRGTPAPKGAGVAGLGPGSLAITASMTDAAWQAANDVGAKAILCCTISGTTARAMARFRPAALLIGLSPEPRTTRQLAMSWGVLPLDVDRYGTTDEMVWFAVERAVKAGVIETGDVVAVLAGAPDTSPHGGATDVLRLVLVK